ncbi:14364_t:CDS:1, partial [Gigaspora margarita]
YLYGAGDLGRKSDYTTSYKFIKENLQLDESLFSHQDDCYLLSS